MKDEPNYRELDCSHSFDVAAFVEEANDQNALASLGPIDPDLMAASIQKQQDLVLDRIQEEESKAMMRCIREQHLNTTYVHNGINPLPPDAKRELDSWLPTEEQAQAIFADTAEKCDSGKV